MTAGRQCPSRDLLTSLLLGTLPPEQEELINLHLDECPECAAAAREIEGAADPLIDALRASGRHQSPGSPTIVTRKVDVSASPQAPLRLEGYRIVREIGRGGMGVVYEGVQEKLERPVAIKMILTGRLAGQEDRVRFLMEGELLARLNHPNFIQVYEVGTVELGAGLAQPYLVMELVDGGGLRAVMGNKPMPVRDAARQIAILARAVDAAHAQGVVHRDLKPANVLISRDGTLKIGDFGLAKELGAGSSLTPTGITVGTPEYMAPEQARADRTVGPAADIYALGAILYEMLTGKPPFAEKSPVEVILKVLDQPPPPISRLRRDVPRDLATICQKCLEKEPAARYARAADLADDLEGWLDDRPIRARPAGRVERVRKWVRRHPAPAALMALLLISLVAGSGVSAYFGVSATRRAADAQAALGKAEVALLIADHRSAELQLAGGRALADAGEVDRGMFVMLRGLEMTPAEDDDLRQAVRLNLEAWLPYLPRLRWFVPFEPHDAVFRDDEVIVRHGDSLTSLNPDTGRPLGASGPGSPPASRNFPQFVDLDPTGRWVCCRSNLGEIPGFRVFDRATGQPAGEPFVDREGAELMSRLRTSNYHAEFAGQAAVMRRRITAGADRSWRLWDGTTGRAIGPEVPRPAECGARLLRYRDGRYCWLFAAPGGPVELVDAQSGELTTVAGRLPAELEAPPDLLPERRVLQDLFDENGSALHLWDVAHGGPLQPPWRLSHTILWPRLSADGRRLAGLSVDNRITWYDAARQRACLPSAAAALEASAYSDRIIPGPDGQSCLHLAYFSKALKRFDFPRFLPAHPAEGAGETRFTTTAPPGLTLDQAAFSPDRQLVLLGGLARRVHGPAYARLTAVADGRPSGLPLTDCDSRGIFSPSGRMVALFMWDHPNPAGGTLLAQAYDAKTGRPRGPACQSNWYVHTLAFSPDERFLAVGHVNGAYLCDLQSDAKPVLLQQPGPVTGILFSRDGRRVALCSRSGWQKALVGVLVWDVETKRRAGRPFPMNDSPILLANESGDGFFTIERDHGHLRRWDFAAAAPVEDLGPLADWPTTPRDRDQWTIDADRRWLAFAATHGTVRRWNLRTGRRLGPDAEFGRPIANLLFSHDGRWLAIAGEDGEVGLFDPRTGRPAGPLLTIGVPMGGMAFSRDGGQLLTAAVDGRIIRWDLGKSLPLTPEQWQTWLQAATGMRPDGDRLVPLTHGEYQEVAAATAGLPTPPRLSRASPAEWHADEAQDAELAGQLNSARWHLDRWITLEPTAWLPLARRARVGALEGNDEAARADLERAAKLCADDGFANWRRHQATINRLTGRRVRVLETPDSAAK